MENLHSLTDSALVDLLAVYTEKYTQMIAEKNFDSPQFEECKILVKILQQEIASRKNPTDDNKPILQS